MTLITYEGAVNLILLFLPGYLGVQELRHLLNQLIAKQFKHDNRALPQGAFPAALPKMVNPHMNQTGTILLAVSLSILGALVAQGISKLPLPGFSKLNVQYLNDPPSFSWDVASEFAIHTVFTLAIAMLFACLYFLVWRAYSKKHRDSTETIDLPWLHEYDPDTDYLQLEYGPNHEIAIGNVKHVIDKGEYPGIYLRGNPLPNAYGLSSIKFVPFSSIHSSDVVSINAIEEATNDIEHADYGENGDTEDDGLSDPHENAYDVAEEAENATD